MRSRAPQPLHPSGPAADPGIAHGRRTFRSGRQRLEASALVFEFLLRAPIRGNGGGKGLRRYRFEDGRDALWLEARLRTSDHHQPPVAPLVEIGIFAANHRLSAKWNENIRRTANLETEKSCLRHADNLEWVPGQ